MLELLVASILIGAAAYRVGRFIVLDTLIEVTRDRFHFWLMSEPTLWREKLHALLSCPFCVTIWTAGLGQLYWAWLIASWPGWWFPILWLTSATVALMFWTYIDSDD